MARDIFASHVFFFSRAINDMYNGDVKYETV